jgi:hypothetical protein
MHWYQFTLYKKRQQPFQMNRKILMTGSRYNSHYHPYWNQLLKWKWVSYLSSFL